MKAKLIVNNQEIEVEISEEEYKKLQPEKKTGYERTPNKIFYWLTGDGGVGGSNDNCEIHDVSYEAANYYSDRTVAENNARADQLMRQLRRFAVEHREKIINWNTDSGKYFIAYDYYKFKLEAVFDEHIRYHGVIYFDSRKTANLAIDTFRDELIWYFTEYKDSLQEQNMNIDKSKVIVTTNKFEQLKTKFNNDYHGAYGQSNASMLKDSAIFNTVNHLLDILSEMVMEDETKQEAVMARYGSGNEETIITEYLDAHLENGIKQKNLDLVLDMMDMYADLVESLEYKYKDSL